MWGETPTWSYSWPQSPFEGVIKAHLGRMRAHANRALALQAGLGITCPKCNSPRLTCLMREEFFSETPYQQPKQWTEFECSACGHKFDNKQLQK